MKARAASSLAFAGRGSKVVDLKGLRTLLFSWPGYLLHRKGQKYFPVDANPCFTLQLVDEETQGSSTPTYYIVVLQDGEAALEQSVDMTTGLQFHAQSGVVCWPSLVEDQIQYLAFKMTANPLEPKVEVSVAVDRFVVAYNRSIYALYTGNSSSKATTKDDDALDYMGQKGSTKVNVDDSEEEVFAFNSRETFSKTGSGKNTCFADSILYNRSLVLQTRGREVFIEAHSFTERGFGTSSDRDEFKVDGVANASEILVAHGDKSVFLVDGNANEQGKLKELDLVKGVVVQTYQPSADVGIKSVKFHNRFASVDDNLLTCLNDCAAFVIDKRLDPKKCVVLEDECTMDSVTYAGAKKDPFICHATSRNGFLAIGDAVGGVRLFTGPPGSRKDGGGHHAKMAKTLINVGKRIEYIDITANGDYVIVTTKPEILVLCTLFLDDKGKAKNGFECKMGKEKPLPLVLLPNPEQIVAMGGKVSFVKATLEQNENGEQWISAICGNHICMWNMERIKQAVQEHESVICEGKSVSQSQLLSIDMPGKNDIVSFLTDGSVGIQQRDRSVMKKKTGFSF